MDMSTLSYPHALLFDLDGTLLLEKEPAEQSWKKACIPFAHLVDAKALFQALLHADALRKERIKDHPEKQRRERLDPSVARKEQAALALHHLGADVSLTDQLVQEFERHREQRELAPGADETLQKLQQLGIRLALLTNGNATYQRRKLQRFQLESFFSLILIEEETGSAKPEPSAYSGALTRLQLQPSHVWMVGDNLELDIAAPQRLGLSAIWYDREAQGLPLASLVQPNAIIHALPDVLSLLEASR
ncbi:HAD family hydrolase [Thermosporothrix hazakensis]|jgi:putative hydrolase of the HAD superfamily|nr:HAD family hydrolase [Thermosporothrix hazakensis]GCE50635.1 phosphoglycolate phosphatase [Thermosporothrix hazakensis]